MHALLLTFLLAAPTRLAKCDSGKTGKLELFVQRAPDGTWALSSRDGAQPGRIFTGRLTSAKHQKLDKRHHAYVFSVDGGELTQAAGLDAEHCKADGQVERCAFTSMTVKLARGGPREPGDDGLDVGVAMDNGAPQGCTVYASRALKALLAAAR